VKLAFFNELYLTLQTDFVACRCFWFSADKSSIEQVCPSLLYTIIKYNSYNCLQIFRIV